MTFDHRFHEHRMGARSTTILANWLSWKVENSPFSSTLHLWHFPSLVRQVTTVLCLQQIRQSRIQSQAWRDSLNHLEERQGWSPSPLFPCPFPCGSSFPKFSWLHARGGRESRSFRHARWRTTKPPHPNSTANYVPTSRGFNPRSRGFLLSHPF